MEKVTCREKLLDTLAINGTTFNSKGLPINEKIVSGNGTELNNTKQLQGWAKRKIITQKMVLALIDIAKKKGKTDQIQSYWNTFHCLNNTTSSGTRLYGKYCKNRYCSICLGIRKAEILNKYLPILLDWENPYFVTLTIKAVPACRLNVIMNKMVQGFQRIKDKYKKKHQRGQGIQLIGIKSLECNFNPNKRTYNPHFHIIVPDEVTAKILIKEWLILWKHWAYRGAQNMRKVENLERDLIECVKYGTKIFTEPDVNNKIKQKITPYIYVSALDNILTAMQGHRLFDRFGFNLPIEATQRKVKFTSLVNYDDWEYDTTICDWINNETGQILTGYNLPSDLNTLLDNNINITLQ